jgi:hypothetical protein
MRKELIFGGILCITLIAFLFHHSCKRNTLLIGPSDRIFLPDSSWIYGTINLDQIKKEVAWSTLLSGDFLKLFHSDTLSSTLLSVLKSPSTYSIVEENNILFFSEWKKVYAYNSLLLKLDGADALKASFKSDSIKVETSYVYSFRTQEGFWMYNTNNLLYIASQVKDSIYALHLFENKHTNISEPIPSDSILIQTIIRTAYLPDNMQNPFLDSARIEMTLKQDVEALQLDWTYNGKISDILTNASIKLPHTETGFFLSSKQTAIGVDKALTYIDTTTNLFKKNKSIINVFKAALDNNVLRMEFNGWKKMKTNYYISKNNEEFEMVLQKVDTTFIEPLFKCTLEQINISKTNTLLFFLKKEGLITKESQNNYSIILGDFNSNLTVEKNNSITIENKHKHPRLETSPEITTSAALYVELNPAYLEGLFDGSIQKDIPPLVLKRLKKIESITINAIKNKTNISGTTTIRFNERSHPITALLGLLKE